MENSMDTQPTDDSAGIFPETDGWDIDAESHSRAWGLHGIFIVIALIFIAIASIFAWDWTVQYMEDGSQKTLTMYKTSDKELTKQLPRYRNLESLRISNSPNITDLQPIEHLKNLQELHIDDCIQITNKQIDDLQKNMVNCKILFN